MRPRAKTRRQAYIDQLTAARGSAARIATEVVPLKFNAAERTIKLLAGHPTSSTSRLRPSKDRAAETSSSRHTRSIAREPARLSLAASICIWRPSYRSRRRRSPHDISIGRRRPDSVTSTPPATPTLRPASSANHRNDAIALRSTHACSLRRRQPLPRQPSQIVTPAGSLDCLR